MSLTNSSIPIVSANDTSTYYVSMLPVTSGKSGAEFISPNLKFNSTTNQLTVNDVSIVKKPITTTSNVKPTNPNVGDIWYDTSTDTQFQYTYDGTGYVWVDISGLSFGVPIAAALEAIYPTGPFQIYYLVVAGGGGGGVSGATPPADTAASGGGGGGGGVLVGTLDTPIPHKGNLIIMTVGTGGTGGSAYPPLGCTIANRGGSPGNDSTLSTPIISPQIAKGGGGGGGGQRGAPGTGPDPLGVPGKTGGSGGGAYAPGVGSPFCSNQAGQALNFPGPLAQGTTGGRGYYVYGGGGGGAGANTGTNAPAAKGGNGGAGYTWIYNSLTYGGGGGGGGGVFGPNRFGCGGPGGGGAGNPTCGCGGTSLRGVPGTHGTGGGGGGAYGGNPPSRAIGGNGAPGAIVLSIPTPRFTGNSQGAFSVTSSPTYVVLEYRGSAGSPNVFSYTV